MATDIIIHDQKDNVGVVVIEKITPKQDCNCWIMENDSSTNIQSMDEIPLGHKIAMVDLKEGDTILDTHLGSGSIALACHNLGYDLTACELEKEYYDSAIKRINQHKAQIRMF